MLRKKLWLLVCLMMVLAGCGGSSTQKGASFGGGARAPRTITATDDGSSTEVVAQSGPAREASSPPSPAAGDRASDARPAPAAAPPSASAREERASSADASGSSASRAPREPAPETRPGLGTEWGETRSSRVHDVTFVRESSRPFAVATMHYNDRKGVDALASRFGSRDSRRTIETGGGAVSISIRDANGAPLEAVRVGEKTLVVGQAGQRYSIVLTNHTGHRFEAVATVDGLDVINGKPGNFDHRGYVLLPFATLEIEGFRQSTNAVAAFRFAAVAESYAAQTGSARNVGVIGVALFAERGDAFVPESELRMRESASPFPTDPRFAQPPRR